MEFGEKENYMQENDENRSINGDILSDTEINDKYKAEKPVTDDNPQININSNYAYKVQTEPGSGNITSAKAADINDRDVYWQSNQYVQKSNPGVNPYFRKSHTVKNTILIITVLIFTFMLGGAAMYGALTTNFADTIAELIYDSPFGRFFNPPAAELTPGDGNSKNPSDNTPEDIPFTNPNNSSNENSEGYKFIPVENPPYLRLITVAGEGENYREVLDIPDIAERSLPSVVRVERYSSDNPTDGYAIGSGTIFTSDGYIITNAHVVENAYSIKVVLSNGDSYKAAIISSDSNADIAILKIEAEGLIPVEFGDSRQLRVGELSVAIGCPASVELQGTTTAGIISAVDRIITIDSSGRVMRLLQTDAAINPGNSGGPLLNKYGQVIGINTVKLSSDTYEGLCFAIPSSELENIVSDLLTYGYVHGYPAIGISASSVLSSEDGSPAGVLIATVNAASGAYGKIIAGDIITHCNGEPVIAVSQINTIKNRLKVGDTIMLTIYRNGETLDIEIPLVDQYDLVD